MYTELTHIHEFSSHDGMAVSISGTISHMPWQHMIHPPDDCSEISYFDALGDQTVVYSKIPINEKRQIRIFGTVTKIQGTSKRPGSDAVFTEYHLIADRWEVI